MNNLVSPFLIFSLFFGLSHIISLSFSASVSLATESHFLLFSCFLYGTMKLLESLTSRSTWQSKRPFAEDVSCFFIAYLHKHSLDGRLWTLRHILISFHFVTLYFSSYGTQKNALSLRIIQTISYLYQFWLHFCWIMFSFSMSFFACTISGRVPSCLLFWPLLPPQICWIVFHCHLYTSIQLAL